LKRRSGRHAVRATPAISRATSPPSSATKRRRSATFFSQANTQTSSTSGKVSWKAARTVAFAQLRSCWPPSREDCQAIAMGLGSRSVGALSCGRGKNCLLDTIGRSQNTDLMGRSALHGTALNTARLPARLFAIPRAARVRQIQRQQTGKMGDFACLDLEARPRRR
jgi:hypothetical protein